MLIVEGADALDGLWRMPASLVAGPSAVRLPLDWRGEVSPSWCSSPAHTSPIRLRRFPQLRSWGKITTSI